MSRKRAHERTRDMAAEINALLSANEPKASGPWAGTALEGKWCKQPKLGVEMDVGALSGPVADSMFTDHAARRVYPMSCVGVETLNLRAVDARVYRDPSGLIAVSCTKSVHGVWPVALEQAQDNQVTIKPAKALFPKMRTPSSGTLRDTRRRIGTAEVVVRAATVTLTDLPSGQAVTLPLTPATTMVNNHGTGVRSGWFVADNQRIDFSVAPQPAPGSATTWLLNPRNATGQQQHLRHVRVSGAAHVHVDAGVMQTDLPTIEASERSVVTLSGARKDQHIFLFAATAASFVSPANETVTGVWPPQRAVDIDAPVEAPQVRALLQGVVSQAKGGTRCPFKTAQHLGVLGGRRPTRRCARSASFRPTTHTTHTTDAWIQGVPAVDLLADIKRRNLVDASMDPFGAAVTQGVLAPRRDLPTDPRPSPWCESEDGSIFSDGTSDTNTDDNQEWDTGDACAP